jgi:phospholipid/cholesterol/gamma-HCH transport system substrate-binding protein
MKRSAYITWDQLKVGSIILVALLIMTLAMYKLGQAANLFSSRYELVTFVQDVAGLRQGGSVTIAGQLAGVVKEIELLPVDADTTRNLRIVFEINEDLRQQVRGDSRARLRTMGLLGDKVLDVSVGTPRHAPLTEGDTVPSEATLDYEAIITKAAGSVDDVVALTRDLRQLTGGIVRGEGTVGQMLTNRALYDQLTSTMARMNATLTRIQTSQGTLGRLIDDPRMYDRMVAVLRSADSLFIAINNSQGSFGKLLRDTTLYASMVGVAQSVDSVTKMLTNPNGMVGRMLTDHELYDQLVKLSADLNAVMADVRRDPQRYTRGMITVPLFGGGGKKK